jgi:hypothetical protein
MKKNRIIPIAALGGLAWLLLRNRDANAAPTIPGSIPATPTGPGGLPAEPAPTPPDPTVTNPPAVVALGYPAGYQYSVARFRCDFNAVMQYFDDVAAFPAGFFTALQMLGNFPTSLTSYLPCGGNTYGPKTKARAEALVAEGVSGSEWQGLVSDAKAAGHSGQV